MPTHQTFGIVALPLWHCVWLEKSLILDYYKLIPTNFIEIRVAQGISEDYITMSGTDQRSKGIDRLQQSTGTSTFLL
jgi:hypothetical protein